MLKQLVGFSLGLSTNTREYVRGTFARQGIPYSDHNTWEEFLSSLKTDQIGCVVGKLGPQSTESEIAAIQDLRKNSSLFPVVLVDRTPLPLVVEAFRVSITTIVLWPQESALLDRFVRDAVRKSIQAKVERTRSFGARERLDRLRIGERQVLELLLKGYQNKNIAKSLGISMRTVEARRNRIFTKLETRVMSEITHLVDAAEATRAPQPHFLTSPASCKLNIGCDSSPQSRSYRLLRECDE